MHEYFAVRTAAWPRDLFLRRSDGKRSMAMALAAGLALALLLALLLGSAPRAWAAQEEGELVPSSSQRALVFYDITAGYGQTYGPNKTFSGNVGATYTVNNGEKKEWDSSYYNPEHGGVGVASGDVGYRGAQIPFIVEDWSTDGKPFSLYFNGEKIAGSSTGGEVQHFSVSWDAFVQVFPFILGQDQDVAHFNADFWIRGWGEDSSEKTTYYRPKGAFDQGGHNIDKVSSNGWNLHRAKGRADSVVPPSASVIVGKSCLVELVLYDRVGDSGQPEDPGPTLPDDSEMEPPAVSLEHEDGTPYEEGTWTNKNVVLEGTSSVLDNHDGYYITLLENDKGEVARSEWVTSPSDGSMKARYVVDASTPVEGAIYSGALFDKEGLPLSVGSPFKTVKVDKEAPVISSIDFGVNTPSVSASDALSGIASIEGRGEDFGVEDWRPIDEIFLGDNDGVLHVKVTDNAGNVATHWAVLVVFGGGDSGGSGGGDGGDDTPRQGDGFKARRAA